MARIFGSPYWELDVESGINAPLLLKHIVMETQRERTKLSNGQPRPRKQLYTPGAFRKLLQDMKSWDGQDLE